MIAMISVEQKGKEMNKPWLTEPDTVDFSYRGFAGAIRRGPMDTLNGYVGVSSDHPAYAGVDKSMSLDCHWGVTYHGWLDQSKYIDRPVWYIGFDCSHINDYFPKLGIGDPNDYKDIDFVTNEIKKLADQLYMLQN